ncbi:hypothetical protein ACGFJ7_36935 [Actinoplanes sp. NPDC048988]|uniref:hypothetical protein n=1 Tax=Actinoplanes sp. NPDC048988 TaxID=3363901 RepID=UPI0037205A83
MAESTGRQGLLANTMFMAAHRGREAEALELTATGERQVTERGVGRLLRITGYAKAVLYNGPGRRRRPDGSDPEVHYRAAIEHSAAKGSTFFRPDRCAAHGCSGRP